ncbi:MAG: septum formation initiator family protein [Candidatus Omnitrophica bacterium]|nr:septum formation initiator family protein [Candidatus Omnitrophota bacterium]
MGNGKRFLIFLIFVIIVFIVFIPSYTRIQDLRQKNSNYEREIVQLHDMNRELAEERRLLNDDPEYLEKIAREKMGLVKEGEIIYRIESLNARMAQEQ